MTTAVAAFIPAQRPATDPVPAPAVPAPSIPRPRALAAEADRVQTTATAPAPAAAGVRLPRTAAERRAYARQIVADAYYDLYSDVFTSSTTRRTA